MGVIRYFITFSLLLLVNVATVSAKPLEITSENFIFYGDASEKRAQELIEGLEAYRAILFSIYNANPGPEFIPVKIVGFKSQKELEKATGHDNISGLYSTTLEGPVFLLATDDGLKEGRPGWNIAFHEYTHHILASFTDTTYPTWYNEGLAEYLSTFKIRKDGQFEIGYPRKTRAWTLANYEWMPIDRLLGAIKGYPFKSAGGKSNTAAQSLFYAQSWLVVHYIQSHPQYYKKAPAYFKLVDKFTPEENAFETAFGVSTETFEATLKEYYKTNKYPYKRVQLKNAISVSDVHVREITKAEVKAQQGNALRMMIPTDKGHQTARDYLQKAESKLGLTQDILLSKSLMALQESEFETSVQLAKQALALNPQSRHANRVLGITTLLTYEALGTEYGSIDEARKYLKKAMKAYPDDATAHYYYAHSFNVNGQTPSRQALASADGALNYFRNIRFLKNNMDMAQILIKGGQFKKAAPVLERVSVWAPAASARRFAKAELKRLGYDTETNP